MDGAVRLAGKEHSSKEALWQEQLEEVDGKTEGGSAGGGERSRGETSEEARHQEESIMSCCPESHDQLGCGDCGTVMRALGCPDSHDQLGCGECGTVMRALWWRRMADGYHLSTSFSIRPECVGQS